MPGLGDPPLALGDANPSLLVSLGALFIVILCASLGQAVLQYAGARIRSKIKWQPVRALDAVGGSVLSALAVLLVVAIVGGGFSGGAGYVGWAVAAGVVGLVGLVAFYRALSTGTMGIVAPIVLVTLRILQGLALGGEYGGAATYVAEHAPNGRRGYFTSWIQTTATLGLFLSLLVITGVRAGGRRDLISGFDDDYFSRIRPVWDERSIEIARRLVSGLFPASESLQPVDRWLAQNDDAPASLRRLVIEQRDRLARVLRVRAAQASL